MNENGKKLKGFSKRLIALLLCCCFVAAMPIAAAAQTEKSQITAGSGEFQNSLSPGTSESDVDTDEQPGASDDSQAPTADLDNENDADTETGVETGTETAAEGDSAETQELSFYEQLMAAETCERVFTLMMAEGNRDAVYALTADQLTALRSRVNELEDDGYQTDVLDTLDMLLSNANGETWNEPVTLEERTYTIQAGNSQSVTGVSVDSGSLEYQCWQEGISVARNSKGRGYTISVAESVPAGTYDLTVTYQFNGRSQTDKVTVMVTRPDTSQYTFTVTPVLSNVGVVYFAYHTASDVTNNINFTRVTNGTPVVIENFSYRQPGYLLFFVKPEQNYLLTSATGTGNGDVYDISAETGYGNINNYPGIETIAAQAEALGYIGVLGYSRGANNSESMTHTITLAGKSPDIQVAAVSNKTSGVKPGDELTFTVTITPGQIGGNATVAGVTIESLQINGQNVTYSGLSKNADGTYTTTVQHTATEADCNEGSVVLNVTAQVSYNNTLGVSNNQTLDSTASITKSATTTCLIAPKNSVIYRLNYAGAGSIEFSAYPAFIKTKPANVENVYSGDSVPVNNFYTSTTVDDTTNRGTWTFDGWYHSDEKVSEVTMGEDTIYLDGTWTFTPYSNANLTVKKTVSGNMYDANKAFTFTVTADKDMTYGETTGTMITFSLKKNEEATISVPVGAAVAISEDPNGYEYSFVSITDGVTKEDRNNGISFTMPRQDVIVVINNDKTVTVDTGVLLDTLPYVLILGVVAVGAVLMLRKRRVCDDY